MDLPLRPQRRRHDGHGIVRARDGSALVPRPYGARPHGCPGSQGRSRGGHASDASAPGGGSRARGRRRTRQGGNSMNEITPDRILDLGFGFWGAKTLLSAVELGVFTELAAAGALDAD